jgi:hypothetical protein
MNGCRSLPRRPRPERRRMPRARLPSAQRLGDHVTFVQLMQTRRFPCDEGAELHSPRSPEVGRIDALARVAGPAGGARRCSGARRRYRCRDPEAPHPTRVSAAAETHGARRSVELHSTLRAALTAAACIRRYGLRSRPARGVQLRAPRNGRHAECNSPLPGMARARSAAPRSSEMARRSLRRVDDLARRAGGRIA